jgi:hypothetical protein
MIGILTLPVKTHCKRENPVYNPSVFAMMFFWISEVPP